MNSFPQNHNNGDPAEFHQLMTKKLIQSIHQFFAINYQFSNTLAVRAQLLVQLDNSQDRLYQFENSVSKDDIKLPINAPDDDVKSTTAGNDKEIQTDLLTNVAATQTEVSSEEVKIVKVTRSTSKDQKAVEPDVKHKEDNDSEDVCVDESDSDHAADLVVLPTVPPEDTSSPEKSKNEPVSCPLCSATFKSQGKVENHLRVNHDIGNVYLCSFCEEICPSNRALHQHLEEKHDQKQPQANTKKRGRKPSIRNVKKLTSGLPLKKSLTVTKALSKAQNKGSKKKLKTVKKQRIPPLRLKIKNDQYVREKFSCEECEKVYSSSKALRRHDLSAHKKNKYGCNICDKKFCSKESLYHHKRGIHAGEKPYTCEECGSSFNFSHSLKLHMLKHSGKRPFQCVECDKTYLTSNHLKMHMIGVHQNNKIHTCRFCSKSFAYKTSLKVHEMTHENIKPYKCKYCDKGFVNSHSLKYHTESKHEMDKWFKCEVCQKEFKTEFSMKTHRRRHSMDGNRFMCDVCGRQFMYKSTLEIHTAIHKDEKTYQCSTCGKSFKTYATLYSHQYVHKTESPYPCPECGKPFKTKERCKAHQKRHAGTKSYSCDICGNLFQDKGGLSKHKRTVHADYKRFACPVCGKTCSRADNLRVHMKIHGKLTQNSEPIDTTTSIESQVEKATYNAVADEMNRQQHEQRVQEPEGSEPAVGVAIPEHRKPSPSADSYASHHSVREMSESPTLTPLASSRTYHEQPHFTNISPAPNLNVPLALTSMASSHIHPTDSSDVPTPHGGPVTQIPNPSPFMYMWPYINPHQNVQNAQEHEYYGQ
ncbi:KRAB [Mytilus edulis]|uniref:KRAB n=1 Tax=Mytilus edulis TaxID=6550 RepID=A0A8S3QJN1_MYTED|nr:KRAB [Mytilus edulis]